MSAGRPPMFSTAEEVEKKVQDYFNQFIKKEIVNQEKQRPLYGESRPSITGLCLFLGFESRQSFHDYQEKPGFSYTFKKARMRIENMYEQYLTSNGPTGPIFALKNMGWTDKQEIEQKTELTGSLSFNGIKIIKPDDQNP